MQRSFSSRVQGTLVVACVVLSSLRAHAQANDGFQRRDGSMYVLRNGQARPMLRDVHLPNGRTVTRDGFVVERDGRRTELAEGRGCTLLGQPVAVVTRSNGRLSLAAPMASAPVAVPAEPALLQAQRWRNGKERGHGKGKKAGKHKKNKHGDDDDED